MRDNEKNTKRGETKMRDEELMNFFDRVKRRMDAMEERHGTSEEELWALTTRVAELEKERDRMNWKIRELERR